MQTIDARGLSCPEPVLLTKKTLDNGCSGSLRVLVDELGVYNNITALAKKYKRKTSYIQEQGFLAVTVEK